MAIAVRPSKGVFLRPFGCAWFIVEFLKVNGPEGSRKIDQDIGAPMVDIYYAYKTAPHRAYDEDAVDLDEERFGVIEFAIGVDVTHRQK